MTADPFDLSYNEQTLVRLREEWHAIVTRRHQAQRWQQIETVEHWKKAFEQLREERDHLVRQGLWVRGPADVLSILGQERREIYHSALLAWLLDPLAPHGLGSGFLRAFMAACDPSWALQKDDPTRIRVETEVARASCRADIVIWSDDFTLVVENKVDALESDRQCDRLYDDFSTEYEARFVFLTPTGEKPKTASGDAEAAFRCLSYHAVTDALARLLHDGLGDAQARGRASALSYLTTLKRELA